MLIKAKTLEGFKLNSLDGEIGKAKEFYFDDRHWTIRYLVADTGGWLTGRQVLISPYALVAADKVEEYITVDLTKQQIENSPSLSSDKPVSQQFELDYYGYYGYPSYWGGMSMWGAYPYIQRDPQQWDKSAPAEKKGDPNLRSTREVSGYHIQATDGEIGHVEDFIIDDQTWAIRYLIVDTVNWWSGKKVLVSPRWIERVSWEESKVFINLPSEIIQQSPEYMQETLLMRDYETRLHQHYNRQGYWVDDSKDLAQPL
ncbi:PRC-barrel domain-containing protein [Chamaesiphon sp.]|uniref:PRC-barrel domain-containing protein n=1 Tax=Chamaesiphon sp. TaxID=2814140 RepID=UPI0035943521